MGLSASKRIKSSLSNSSEFGSACDSAYTHCLSLSQHAFDGVLLTSFSPPLTTSTTASSLPSPAHPQVGPRIPSRAQVDWAFKKVSPRIRPNDGNELDLIRPARFKEWAVVLYAGAVVDNAGKALLSRVPIGGVGIAAVGAVTRSRKDLVGAAIGVYALGVATSVYLSLTG